MNRSDIPIAILGGGPAGLSLAYECQRRGLEALVLEAGPCPGYSWACMPTGLKLLSPWYQNILFHQRWGPRDLHRLVPARDFAAYLEEQSSRLRLPIQCQCPVRALHRDGRGWMIESDRRTLRARRVVNATGYFSCPYIPDLPGLHELKIPRLHFAEYRDPSALAAQLPHASARILIIGKRISAGQAALELHDAGHHVTLACRSPLTYARPPWLQMLVFPVYFPVEDWLVRRHPFWLEDSYPPMEGGRVRSLIRRGRIVLRPAVTAFQSRAAVFADGAVESFDLVLFATGFRPALQHLAHLNLTYGPQGYPITRGFESTEAPGLYFLGFDRIRTFRSRYLRGIREDAGMLAEFLKAESDRTP